MDVAVDVDVDVVVAQDENENEDEDGQQDLQLDFGWHLDGLARLFAQQNLKIGGRRMREELEMAVEGVAGELRCLFVN
ncbi:hypothetical protein M5D96_000794 [Drosophila gunungcola]|uniref:Uncharacterized protein n=1 Tax=Drosophila gunungcola TaxID=103775 RepID=A0A9P9YXF1_9MUSC|nr:hypothetical protein M5D96_000794 [Drosophila gunungcola]